MLADYLASISRRRWEIGSFDCSTFVADWLRQSGFDDPMADLRGTYRIKREYLALIRREGGFVAMVSKRMASIGFKETIAPIDGDPVIVNAPFKIKRGRILRHAVGAICVGGNRRAVVTSDMGLLITDVVNLPDIKAWSLHG